MGRLAFTLLFILLCFAGLSCASLCPHDGKAPARDISRWIKSYEQAWHDLNFAGTWGYRAGPASTAARDDSIRGSIIQVERPGAFALTGPGYFKVRDNMRNKDLYTRNGNFLINSESKLVTSDGYELVPNLDTRGITGEVRLEKLRTDGLPYTIHGKKIRRKTYRFHIFRPGKSATIRRQGTYFQFDKNERVEQPRLLQGFLESSTVDVDTTLYRLWAASLAIDQTKNSRFHSPRTQLIKLLLNQKLNYDGQKHIHETLRLLTEYARFKDKHIKDILREKYGGAVVPTIRGDAGVEYIPRLKQYEQLRGQDYFMHRLRRFLPLMKLN